MAHFDNQNGGLTLNVSSLTSVVATPVSSHFTCSTWVPGISEVK